MVVIIIQARMGSTRLPGKVLKPIAGRPMLFYQIERLRRVKFSERIVVATTTSDADDPIVKFCAAQGIECTRGSELDVLSRYSDAARQFDASTVVRVTSDCPLIDPELIDRAIAAFFGSNHPDYVSNMLEPTWPYGMAVEVMTAAALSEANREARNSSEREHVTPFIYGHPERFRLESLTMTPNCSHHRWTVDTPEDFQLVTNIIENLYARKADFNMEDVLKLLAEHPDWACINAHIQQKSVMPLNGRN
jgi:spore coat polysaccharide biosynthesis protein SpsF